MSFARPIVTTVVGLIVLGPAQAFAQESTRFSIAIQARKVELGQKTIRVTQGQAVELAFTADEMVELHLHGYDRLLTVQPGSPGVMRLQAKTAGRFAIEGYRFGNDSRSRRHVVLLYLEVHPR
jgi:FtsP/CotA-like multicopper oxidase with cupredoxin domain